MFALKSKLPEFHTWMLSDSLAKSMYIKLRASPRVLISLFPPNIYCRTNSRSCFFFNLVNFSDTVSKCSLALPPFFCKCPHSIKLRSHRKYSSNLLINARIAVVEGIFVYRQFFCQTTLTPCLSAMNDNVFLL